jgi:hypothetical protein
MGDEGERGYRATENQSAKQARGAFASPTHSWIISQAEPEPSLSSPA